MVIGGSSGSGATTESHPGSQPQIAVNPDAAPWRKALFGLTFGRSLAYKARRPAAGQRLTGKIAFLRYPASTKGLITVSG
jgi:hypothetical protein